jgi:uncharacterized protein YeaO (DUF488 family)
MTFEIKRVYDPAQSSDGVRVLVDRLWPRGLRKSDAHLDHWMKDVAPSPRLRLWFGHKPERFAEFSKHYKRELASNTGIAKLRKLGRSSTVTLLYGARDANANHAVVLQSVLRKQPGAKRAKRPA